MDYVASDGSPNYVAKDYKKLLSVREQVATDALLEILSKKQEWKGNNKEFEILSGKNYQGIGEVKLPGDQKIPIRLFGFFDKEKKHFVILIVCRHKDNRYNPANCMDTAVNRRKALANGIGTTTEHFNDDDEEAGEE